MLPSTTIYEKVVKVSTDYLGPAGERFIRRQIEAHIDKPPEKITKRDLVKLIDWVTLTFALLTDNHQLVEAFEQELASISSSRGQYEHRK